MEKDGEKQQQTRGIVAPESREPAMPQMLGRMTEEIERGYIRDQIADGHLWVFGLSMLYKSMHHLPEKDRREKFNELMVVLEGELFPAQEEPIAGSPAAR